MTVKHQKDCQAHQEPKERDDSETQQSKICIVTHDVMITYLKQQLLRSENLTREIETMRYRKALSKLSSNTQETQLWTTLMMTCRVIHDELGVLWTKNKRDEHKLYMKLVFGTQLLNAARDGDAVTVTALLYMPGAHSFINYQDEHGFTPLHEATGGDEHGKGHAAVTKLLISARCNVDLQEVTGFTPLHLAAQLSHQLEPSSMAKQLLAVRCRIDLQDVIGRTALQLAEMTSFAHGGIATLIRNINEAPLLGRRVAINGLVTKPELNGRTGTALSFDDDMERYSVELDESASSFMIKPCNLLPEVCSVALCHLFSDMHTLPKLS
jgi:hypothetical protein